jgi:PAS domain S-box-containing protein
MAAWRGEPRVLSPRYLSAGLLLHLLYSTIPTIHMRKNHSKSERKTRTKRAKDRLAKMPLAEANRRLKSIQVANEVATWVWDVRNNSVVADANLMRLFGVSPEDAVGGPIEKYVQAIHPDDRKTVQDAIAMALDGPNDRYEVNYRLVRNSGEISWVSARGTVERDSTGKPIYFLGVVIDISELRATQQKSEDLRSRLNQQAQVLNITLSHISDFAYIFNRDGRFVFVNQALLDLWGLKLEEAVGKNFFDLKYPDELAARLQQQIQTVFETKAGLTDETEYTSQTGAGGYYEYIFRPVLDREGKVELVAGSTRDITYRKRVEADLRQSQERLRILAESLDTKVQERTKELQMRTDNVLQQSELLRQLSMRLMKTQDEERRRIAREMHDSAGQTIAALAISLGQISSRLSGVDPPLQELASQAQAMVKELESEIRTTSYLLHPPLLDELGLRAALGWYLEGLRERVGIEVRLSMAEFERLSEDMELTIFRVIQECLTNIHRHSGSKSADISLVLDDANVVIEVRDFGTGISEQNLARIRNRGVGVGLRGMLERVRPFAGDVRIDSEEGKGTTITITVPHAHPTESRASSANAASE